MVDITQERACGAHWAGLCEAERCWAVATVAAVELLPQDHTGQGVSDDAVMTDD